MEPAEKKSDPIVAGLMASHGFTPAEAEKAAGAVVETLKRELLRGGQVSLPGFAALRLVEKRAHIVKDPETGHQFIRPAENAIELVPSGPFQREIASAKLSSIVLAVPHNDTFARVVEFHFTRVGWRVKVVSSGEEGLRELREGGAHLLIVDHALEGATRLIEEARCTRATSRTPIIGLYPSDRDPASSLAFQVVPDERLVEPFEVYALLMAAESELARAGEEQVIFEQQVQVQLGTGEANQERAIELVSRLLGESGMTTDNQELLKAAVREAVGNAAQHGNRDDAGKRIHVQYLLDREKATVSVTDEGPGFDHERYVLRAQTKDAVSAARERHEQGRQGGLGIMLMQKCADKVEFSSTGNTLTLTKRLVPLAALPAPEEGSALAQLPS